MLKVKLIENDGLMKIEQYLLTYPFNLPSDNDNETYYNLNSIEYKNIKVSFRVFFCKKFDFSGFTHDGEKKIIKNGKITDIKNSHTHDSSATQLLLFTQRLLFFVDEKNYSSSLKPEKQIFPHFLLINEEVAKKNIQFFISYVESKSEKFIKNEELIFYLNLFRNERIIG